VVRGNLGGVLTAADGTAAVGQVECGGVQPPVLAAVGSGGVIPCQRGLCNAPEPDQCPGRTHRATAGLLSERIGSYDADGADDISVIVRTKLSGTSSYVFRWPRLDAGSG
jgi:hypothetical protein